MATLTADFYLPRSIDVEAGAQKPLELIVDNDVGQNECIREYRKMQRRLALIPDNDEARKAQNGCMQDFAVNLALQDHRYNPLRRAVIADDDTLKAQKQCIEYYHTLIQHQEFEQEDVILQPRTKKLCTLLGMQQLLY